MNSLPYASETLHIALISLPQDRIQEHAERLIDHYYTEYRKEVNRYYGLSDIVDLEMYNPLRYFIFGNYDVAFVSLVNNYKFTQKQLTHKKLTTATNSYTSDPYSFQVITGSCPIINAGFSVHDFFEDQQKRQDNFICISNLKLNNKLLIGTGNNVLEPVIRLIDKVLKEIMGIKEGETPHSYFLQQTHSWFELTVVLFSDETSIFTKVLSKLRSLTLNDLAAVAPNSAGLKKTILKQSLYELVLVDDGHQYENTNPHILSDTHTYMGYNFDYKLKTDKVEFLDAVKTQIEWEVKPGHSKDLYEQLSKIKVSGKQVFDQESYLLLGKTDFYTQPTDNSLVANLEILNQIDANHEVFKFVRKIKTRIQLPSCLEEDKVDSHPHHPDFTTFLQERLAFDSNKMFDINAWLKILKVSRNVRNKINKIYFNYNNGIQDPILFTYFLDFHIFIKSLTDLISNESTQFQKLFSDLSGWPDFEHRSVNVVEDALLQKIEVFDKAFQIRMLNCYHYEDINDFALDYNSSIQQLLTIYNTLVAKLSLIYYADNQHGPVVQLHLKRTVSNIDSINYDVYHLASPEFVFYTLVKEILNKYVYGDEKHKRKDSDKGRSSEPTIRMVLSALAEEVELSDLEDFKDIVEFERYFLDGIKFLQTCNGKFELYEYWFWAYNLQTASMYDKIGTLNEIHFKKELLRLYFIANLFGIEMNNLRCPIPELYYLWERYHQSIRDGILNLFKTSKQISAFKSFMLSIFNYPVVSKGEPDDAIAEEATAFWNKIIVNIEPHYLVNLGLLKSTNILDNFTYGLRKATEIQLSLQEGIPYYYNAEDKSEYQYINALMYAYLDLIYRANKEVRLLRRDWKTGAPLSIFLEDDREEYLYAIDPFGGIFFATSSSSRKYFKIRNAVIQSLWHFSLICKKNLFFKS